MTDDVLNLLRDAVASAATDKALADRLAAFAATSAEVEEAVTAANAKIWDVQNREAAVAKAEKALAKREAAVAKGEAQMETERARIEREKARLAAIAEKVAALTARVTTDEEPAA